MSGGFFRGTSADQDTRFSNKQAKLLKSQKFPPELDHLVDVTKVKMDVIKPWIATRATELLGFEDEVLINFIYGLLDGKLVDGKKIQIQLTGFMEKNTGKFMKELWGLLLSAQNNASGVPQQFLDAKEEETKKKKAETDRIASEIQKRREKDGRGPERERRSRFDGDADISRSNKAAPDSVARMSKRRSSSIQPEDEKQTEGKSDSRAINGRSQSPKPKDTSPSLNRNSRSPRRSKKRSVSRSRSNSGKEPRSRSVSMSLSPRPSVSPAARRSISPERRYRSRRSISPRRRYSPRSTRSPRRRSPGLRRRPSRSPSPYRRRSPRARQRSPQALRRRSPSPSRRRSPSPFRRRSPLHLRRRSPPPSRRRSPSPVRRRSPIPLRRRSPSPLSNKSPVIARRRSPSPSRRRSPTHGRSFSPVRKSLSPRRRSPLRRSPKQRGRSPMRSPDTHAADSSPRRRKRSRSPYRSRSPLHQARRGSKDIDSDNDGPDSPPYRNDRASQRMLERSPSKVALERKMPEHGVTLRSPQRDTENKIEQLDKIPAAVKEGSPGRSRDSSRHRSDSTRKKSRNSAEDVGLKKSATDDAGPEPYSPIKAAGSQSPATGGRPVNLNKNSWQRSEGNLQQASFSSDDIEYGPASKEHRELHRSKGKVDKRNQHDSKDTDSGEIDSDKNRPTDKRKHKKSDKRNGDSDDSSDSGSQLDDRKEAKRRRKEEKRRRKEERRRRREERHRKKSEHRSSKHKLKSEDMVALPSIAEKRHDDSDYSDADARKNFHPSDGDEGESEQKRLEIELRKKALESLKAKKAISH